MEEHDVDGDDDCYQKHYVNGDQGDDGLEPPTSSL